MATKLPPTWDGSPARWIGSATAGYRRQSKGRVGNWTNGQQLGVIVVGGGLGALRAAEATRGAGYAGPITVLGRERHLPYNRPPLSKEALAGGVDPTFLEFSRRVTDVDYRVGAEVVSCDLARGSLTLADGEQLPFDGLVAATGLEPRRLGAPGPIHGRHVLRTIEDAQGLRQSIISGRRVLIIGAGFVGCEVAATATTLGAEVTCVAAEAEPMIRPLGRDLGAAMRERHEEKGVKFRLGVGVERFTGDDRVTGVVLSTGEELGADVVVEAVGSRCNVEWLEGNGLDLADGVRCDQALRITRDGKAIASAFAAGDIARFPNVRFDEVPRRVEHWSMPTDTGRHAGRVLGRYLIGGEVTAEACAPLPSFWSDQYAVRLQSFGMPGIADEIRLLGGDPEGEVTYGYFRNDGGRELLVGVAGIGRMRELIALRAEIGETA